jgi:hypothetical protein
MSSMSVKPLERPQRMPECADDLVFMGVQITSGFLLETCALSGVYAAKARTGSQFAEIPPAGFCLGELHRNPGSAAGGCADGQRRAIEPGNFIHDCQPKPAAMARGIRRPIEALAHPMTFVLRDTGS